MAENIDITELIHQMHLDKRPDDFMVGSIADALQIKVNFSYLPRKDFEDMAKNAISNYRAQNENIARQKQHNAQQSKEKSFTFDYSSSKPTPQLDPTWSQTWSSEEGESPKQQKTRVTRRSPLTTSVNRNVKSPKRRGRSPARSPARSPGPQTATAIPQRHRSRSRTSEHVSTRASKSPVPNRSPHRAAGGGCSPSVYYDCDQSFSQFRDNSSPEVAREGKARLQQLKESMGCLFVNAGQSPGFHQKMDALNSSIHNLSFNNHSSQDPILHNSFQKCSLEETKFSFDESSGKASAATARVSPRAKMEPKTPMPTYNSGECPGTAEQYSPVEDTPPDAKHPEVSTNADASSQAQPMSSTRSRSRSRSPERKTATFDSQEGASAQNREPAPAWKPQTGAAPPFASPISEFQAPHQMFASEPRGRHNIRPSPQPYLDANSPSFPNSRAQNAAKDPPATAASSSFGADKPTMNLQTTADVQFNVNLPKQKSRQGRNPRRIKAKRPSQAGSTRISQNNIKPTSFDPAPLRGTYNFAQASPSNSSPPPEPMDCGTPAQQNLNDIQFNVGVGGKSTGRPRPKKRDVKHTPVPMQGQQTIPTQAQHPRPVQNPSPIQFSLGVGGKSQKAKSKLSPRAKRSQSAYYQSENVASSSRVGNQDFRARSLADEENILRAAKEATISALRDEAKALYSSNDFRGALLKYSEAISEYKKLYSDAPDKNLLAVLLSNRAACLIHLGAYRAATEDCYEGFTIIPTNQDVTSNDFNPTFKARLLCRMARAYIQLGDVVRAKNLFERAEKNINDMHTICLPRRDPGNAEIEKIALHRVSNDISNGIMDIGKFHEAKEHIKKFNKKKDYSLPTADWENLRTEVLVHVNFALSLASGCDELYEQKVSLLADLRRWREIASLCERLAASRTRLDGCFVGDLASKDLFVGVEPAESLNAASFNGCDENELQGASKKLNEKSICEVILRLPHRIIHFYARSLRLEESYSSAERMLLVLETHITENRRAFGLEDARTEFGWLPNEKYLVDHTKKEREDADKLFRKKKYEEAVERYDYCLRIDSNGVGGKNAGGRLHAVLHCNRAACFIQLSRFHEAATECTAALRIHPWYMKAIKRRAFSYWKMDRHDECIAEYKKWIDFVSRARSGLLHFSQGRFPCIFDGPDKATDADIAEVETILKEVFQEKAQANARARGQEKERREKFQRNPFNHNAPKGDAERRRENFYNQKNDSRRWDSFSNRGPKRSHSKPRSKPSSQNQDSDRYSYKERSSSSTSSNRSQNSRSPDLSADSDHYSVLGVNRHATEAQIKKAFRKMALRYHPDKNSDEGAAEKFRRVEEAKTILLDSQSREEYDQQQFGTRRW